MKSENPITRREAMKCAGGAAAAALLGACRQETAIKPYPLKRVPISEEAMQMFRRYPDFFHFSSPDKIPAGLKWEDGADAVELGDPAAKKGGTYYYYLPDFPRTLRFIGPDATITLDFALARLTGVLDKLLIYPERMQKNLDKMGGLVHSQRVLLALTQAGLERDASYRLVQRNAMKVWESDGKLSLLELLKADPEVSAVMTAGELEEKFNLDYHFKAIDTIFARVFGE